MAEYRASSALLRTLRRRILLVALPMLVVVVAITASQIGTQRGPVLFIVPVIAIVLAVSFLNSYRQQRARIESLRLTIDGDGITRSIDGLPPFTLARAAVQRIVVHASGEITLTGPTPAESLQIPKEIEGRERLLDELRAWAPVEDAPPLRAGRATPLVSLAVIAGFATVVLSQDARVVVPVGIALIAALIWSAASILRNPHVDARTRRLALFMILPLIAIAVRVIDVLRG